MEVAEIYQRQIKALPASDRLKLAAMILNDIPAQAVADYSDEWSEQDLAEFSKQVWRGAPQDDEGEEENG